MESFEICRAQAFTRATRHHALESDVFDAAFKFCNGLFRLLENVTKAAKRFFTGRSMALLALAIFRDVQAMSTPDSVAQFDRIISRRSLEEEQRAECRPHLRCRIGKKGRHQLYGVETATDSASQQSEDPTRANGTESAMPALDLFQSDSRGADLAQSGHELRDDSGIEPVFLPNRPEWYLYRFRRHQIFENNMSSRKLSDWLAHQGDTKPSRNQSERTCRTVCFPRDTRFKPSLFTDGL
jgi:hypothetical protein